MVFHKRVRPSRPEGGNRNWHASAELQRRVASPGPSSSSSTSSSSGSSCGGGAPAGAAASHAGCHGSHARAPPLTTHPTPALEHTQQLTSRQGHRNSGSSAWHQPLSPYSNAVGTLPKSPFLPSQSCGAPRLDAAAGCEHRSRLQVAQALPPGLQAGATCVLFSSLNSACVPAADPVCMCLQNAATFPHVRAEAKRQTSVPEALQGHSPGASPCPACTYGPLGARSAWVAFPGVRGGRQVCAHAQTWHCSNSALHGGQEGRGSPA